MSGLLLPAGLGFTLAVPSAWWELDVRPGSREAALEALVDGQVRDVPELRPHRTALARLLREQARSAWEAGAAYCATLVEPTDDGPVTASVVALVVPAPLTTDHRDRLAVMMEAVAPRPRSEQDGVWRAVEVVQVPGAGPAGRAWGVEDVELPGGVGLLRTVVMQTLVPLPGVDRVLVLTCSSPVLPLTDDLLDLFDAISSTLEILPAEG